MFEKSVAGTVRMISRQVTQVENEMRGQAPCQVTVRSKPFGPSSNITTKADKDTKRTYFFLVGSQRVSIYSTRSKNTPIQEVLFKFKELMTG